MKREVKSFIHARSRTAKKDSETFKEFENKLFFSLKEIKNFDHLFSLNETNILEIGFGNGKNILHQAINNPEKNFYGLEVYQNGIASTLRQIKLHNLNNIFLQGTFFPKKLCLDSKNVSWDLKNRIPRRKLPIQSYS